MDPLFRLPAAVRRNTAVEVWLTDPEYPLRRVAHAWFDRMRRCGKDVREVLHDGHPTACVGDAAFAYVNAFRAHVNVGFFYGAALPDPAGLLVGTGKRMRHVKLQPDDGTDVEALATLIAAAYEDIRARTRAIP
ncbi:MAG: DUF1801 domain-containing protein [Alphaproteobacteria bacterium]